MLVYGGEWATRSLLEDVWALRLGAVLDVPNESPEVIQLGQVTPNPSSRGMSMSLELPRTESVRATVVDLAGRRVRELEDSVRPAGRHWIVWDGRRSNGATAPPGVYVVRVRVGGVEMGRKLVLTR